MSSTETVMPDLESPVEAQALELVEPVSAGG